MELDFRSRHARRRMRLRRITLEMVQMTVDEPDLVTVGIYADLYDKMVDGHLLRVVLAKGTDPAIVKTVMWRPDRVPDVGGTDAPRL